MIYAAWFICPLIFLIVLGWKRPNEVWFAALFSLAPDAALYALDLAYYEAQILVLLFMAVHAVIIAIISVFVMKLRKKR